VLIASRNLYDALCLAVSRIANFSASVLALFTLASTTLEFLAAAVSKGLAELDQRHFSPPPGTVLVREWDRKSHRVMVMPDGFAWNGETFDSLSEIAFAITGTKWNGPRFFGLRDWRPHINGGDSE
jgi:hypothetical protein